MRRRGGGGRAGGGRCCARGGRWWWWWWSGGGCLRALRGRQPAGGDEGLGAAERAGGRPACRRLSGAYLSAGAQVPAGGEGRKGGRREGGSCGRVGRSGCAAAGSGGGNLPGVCVVVPSLTARHRPPALRPGAVRGEVRGAGAPPAGRSARQPWLTVKSLLQLGGCSPSPCPLL